MSITLESLRGEVLTNARHVTQEDRPGSGIGFRRHNLREVDQTDIAIPVEDVVRGQVAVNTLTGQEQIYVTDDALEKWVDLIRVESHRVERRRGAAEIANV